MFTQKDINEVYKEIQQNDYFTTEETIEAILEKINERK